MNLIEIEISKWATDGETYMQHKQTCRNHMHAAVKSSSFISVIVTGPAPGHTQNPTIYKPRGHRGYRGYRGWPYLLSLLTIVDCMEVITIHYSRGLLAQYACGQSAACQVLNL